jgi:hypothetical protein
MTTIREPACNDLSVIFITLASRFPLWNQSWTLINPLVTRIKYNMEEDKDLASQNATLSYQQRAACLLVS